MIYKTSLDNIAKLVTITITILFAVIIISQFAIIKDAGKAYPVFTTVALLVIYFIAFAFRPVHYNVSDSKLIIHRPLSDIKIERTSIKSVGRVEKDKLYGAIRTFGVGGLFGYYGKFANSKLGRMTWYATRRNKIVLLETTDNKRIILTPDEPEKFVANLSAMATTPFQ